MDGTLAELGLLRPFHRAGLQLHAGPATAVGVAVEVAVDQDDAAVVVFQIGVGIEILDRVARAHLDRLAADAVTGGNKHLAVLEDRRRDDGGFAGELALPEQAAIGGTDTGDALHGELDELARAVVVDGDGRGILGGVGPGLALPDFGAGDLVKGRQGALRTAGRADDVVALDQRALAVTPARHLAAQALHGHLPDLLAVGGVQADQHPLATQRVHPAAIDGWRAARAVAPAVGEQGPRLGHPLFLTGGGVDGDDVLDRIACAHGVQRVADDGITRVAETGILVQPDLFGAGGGPLLEQAGFLGDVGAVGTAEGRPVGRLNGNGEGKEGGKAKGIHGRDKGTSKRLQLCRKAKVSGRGGQKKPWRPGRPGPRFPLAGRAFLATGCALNAPRSLF